jgi:hypothetical protein
MQSARRRRIVGSGPPGLWRKRVVVAGTVAEEECDDADEDREEDCSLGLGMGAWYCCGLDPVKRFGPKF